MHNGLVLPASAEQRRLNRLANLRDDLKVVLHRMADPNKLSAAEFLESIHEAQVLRQQIASLN